MKIRSKSFTSLVISNIVIFFSQAFANMTANIRRELCAVMLFAVVEHANIVVLNDGDQVSCQQALIICCSCHSQQ